LFTVGLMTGGVATALGLWVLGSLHTFVPVWISATVLLAIAAIAAGRDLRLLNFRRPSTRRQVPRDIFRQGPVESSLRFGFELGTGFLTQITASAPYIAAAALVLFAPTGAVAVAAGAGFGIGRAIMPVLLRARRRSQGRADLNLGHLTAPISCTLASSVCAVALVVAQGV